MTELVLQFRPLNSNILIHLETFFKVIITKDTLWGWKKQGLLFQRIGVVFPGPTWHLTTVCKSGLGEPDASSGLIRHCTHMMHIHMCKKKPIHIKQIMFLKDIPT